MTDHTRNAQALDKLRKARTQLLLKEPFFATIALRMQPRISVDVTTTATDGHILFFNPEYILSATIEEIKTTLAHLALHIANKHHLRMQGRNEATWNEACDEVVNDQLDRCGFKLSTDEQPNPEFRGKSVEAVYSLMEADKDQQGKGEGEGGGSGKIQGRGDVLPHKGDAEEEAGDVDRDVKQALAAGKKAGNVPADLRRLLEEAQPRADWRTILRDFIQRAGQSRYDWNRPNRRFSGNGVFMPKRVPDGIPQIIIAVDTSGSIDKNMLSEFIAECQSILDEQVVDQIVMVQCDYRVTSIEEIDAGDVINLEVKGGGGTSFAPVFKAIKDEYDDAAALVYFTDLICSTWGEEPEMPVIWAIWGNGHAYGYETAPFGEIARME